MRIQRRSSKKARIEIIPMIDTIFFLLVFFMISTLSMAQYRGMPVNLPKAASGQQAPAESAAVTIDKEGRLFLKRRQLMSRLWEVLCASSSRKTPISWS
jgi:biopolymer transport protein ExbD